MHFPVIILLTEEFFVWAELFLFLQHDYRITDLDHLWQFYNFDKINALYDIL